MKQRYDSYKPSGIEWIGEIPSHWEIFKLKYLVKFNSGDTITAEQFVDCGQFVVYGANGIRGHYDRYNYDGKRILVGRVGALCGNIHLSSTKIWASEHALISTESMICEFDYVWLSYILRAMNLNQYGGGSAQPVIASSTLENLLICVPPLAEQEAIAAWLDEKCGEIDAAIAKVEREIELIDELKQSEISRVVTRGLNPNVPLRPSGIDWIGEIPEHWKIQPIKYPFTLFSGATPKTENKDFWDGDIDWITPADYKTEDHYIFSSNKQITQQGKDSCATELVPPGSIIFSKRAPIGTVAIASIPLCTNQGCISCVPKTDTDSSYYYYLFSIATTEFENHGSGATFLEISATSFANFKIVVPPIAEQQAIADYLDRKCAEIDGLKAKLKRKRDTLVELRQAMISEVVTGKRKVV